MTDPAGYSYKTKVLVYSASPLLFDLSALVHSKFDCSPVQVRDPKQILPNVYDYMPALILAEIGSDTDPAMDVLSAIRKDPVLEYIPVVLISSARRRHDIFQLAAAQVIGADPAALLEQLTFHVSLILFEAEHQLDTNPFSMLHGHHTSLRELENAITLGGDVSVCTIRIWNLEIFGAMYGAMSADVLADRIVEEIRQCAKEVSTRKWLIGHLGWPMFVALLPDDKAQAFAAALTSRFEKKYEEFKTHATQSQFTTALDSLRNNYFGSDRVELSVVVLPLRQSQHRSAEALVRASADLHNRQRTSSAEPSAGAGSESTVTELLKNYLHGGKIETYFQPIVDCWEKNVYAYEALSRFITDSGSFVHPEALFAAARESNQIFDLDLMCLDSAMRAYQALGTTAKLFLNVDRVTFAQLGERIDVFDRYQIPHDKLVIEITEQSIISQRRKILEIKSALKERGIHIAFDDAGTGDVSFREVGEIKPSYIKFDRRLITGINRSTMRQRHVLSMRAFARGIGAATIAEGIEMPSDLEYVKKIRLNYAQGYHIARPQKVPSL